MIVSNNNVCFSNTCEVLNDALVPKDMLDSVAWALEQFVDVLTECTDAQLVAFGHIVRAEDSMTRAQNGRHVAQSALTSNGRLFMVRIAGPR